MTTQAVRSRIEAREKAVELGAVAYRYTVLEKKDSYSGRTIEDTITFLEYYFNEAGDEVGYFNEPCKAFHAFQNPRKWCPKMIEKMTYTKLGEACQSN